MAGMSADDPPIDGRRKLPPKVIPISFLGEVSTRQLAVDEEGFRRLMGYDKLTPAAARQASWRFRTMFGIRKLPGGVYYIEEIKRALDREYKLERQKELRSLWRKQGY